MGRDMEGGERKGLQEFQGKTEKDKCVQLRQKGMTEDNRKSMGIKGKHERGAEKLEDWLNIHKGCVAMGGDVEQRGRSRSLGEANNEHTERHPPPPML